MRCIPFLVVAMLWSGAAWAQPTSTSDLPVSLDHIREGLNKASATWTLKFDVTPDFRTEIHEQQKLDELGKSFDFKGGPIPAGGLYTAEQQRVTSNPTNEPLRQPFAAFSAGQAFTIAGEGLAGRYLVGHAKTASKNDRDTAEGRAREDEARKTAEFCASQPDKGASLPICPHETGTSGADTTIILPPR